MKFPFNLDKRGFHLFTFFLHFTFECHITRTWQNIWRFWHVLSTSNQLKELNRQATQQLLISWQCLSICRCCHANVKHSKRVDWASSSKERARYEGIRVCWTWNKDMLEAGGSVSSFRVWGVVSKQQQQNIFSCDIKWKLSQAANKTETRRWSFLCDIFLSFSPSYTHVMLLMWRRTRWCDG